MMAARIDQMPQYEQSTNSNSLFLLFQLVKKICHNFVGISSIYIGYWIKTISKQDFEVINALWDKSSQQWISAPLEEFLTLRGG